MPEAGRATIPATRPKAECPQQVAAEPITPCSLPEPLERSRESPVTGHRGRQTGRGAPATALRCARCRLPLPPHCPPPRPRTTKPPTRMCHGPGSDPPVPPIQRSPAPRRDAPSSGAAPLLASARAPAGPRQPRAPVTWRFNPARAGQPLLLLLLLLRRPMAGEGSAGPASPPHPPGPPSPSRVQFSASRIAPGPASPGAPHPLPPRLRTPPVPQCVPSTAPHRLGPRASAPHRPRLDSPHTLPVLCITSAGFSIPLRGSTFL